MAFEHENFEGALPPTINFARDKSKFVVSCVEDQVNWARLFYEWADELPVIETQTTRPDTDVDSDTDAELDSSDSSSSDKNFSQRSS
jgi:hypothetical protein